MNAICPVCEAESVRDVVDDDGISRDGMFNHFDDAGEFHRHDPRRRKTRHQCAAGHQWTEAARPPCPAKGCAFGSEDPEVVAVGDGLG